MVKINKIVFLLFLFHSYNSWSLVVSIEDSSNGYLNQFALTSDGNISLNTNKFNLLKEGIVGQLKVKNLKDISANLKKLESIHATLLAIENRLMSKKKSFNDIHTFKPHETYVQVGKFKIPQSNVLYKKTLNTLKEIASNASIKKIDALKLVLKPIQKFEYYKNDKLIKSRPISSMADCENEGPQEVCIDKAYGSFYL